MSLKERLELARPLTSSSSPVAGKDPVAGIRLVSVPTRTDPVAEMKRRAQETLFARVGNRLYDATLSPEQLRSIVISELTEIVGENDLALTEEERQSLVAAATEDVLGYGPIQEYLDDPSVTEIMVNTTDGIYIERNGHLIETGSRFYSADHLRRMIERIASQVGRRIDEASPMVDARLADGSRVNAIIPPLSVDGPILTIRKFARRALSIDDLIEMGTISRQLAEFLEACVKAKVTVVVSGGTGSGKTTFLNGLSSFIPEEERVVTIEDAVELQLQQRHRIRLESRPPNIEGKGLVTIRDLVRNALRMRPDRIVVGEVRGAEALDMLQAMNTGHEGSLTTLHANSPRDALARIETMVLMAGMDLPVTAIREQMASAIDLIVHIERLSDGTRRVVEVSDVAGMESSVVQLNELFTTDFSDGLDANGRYIGKIIPTGIRPSFESKIKRFGIEFNAESFRSENGFARRGLVR